MTEKEVAFEDTSMFPTEKVTMEEVSAGNAVDLPPEFTTVEPYTAEVPKGFTAMDEEVVQEPVDNPPKPDMADEVDFAMPREEMEASYDKHVFGVIGDVIGEEGNFVNHPNDKGGPTKFGIALNFNRDELVKLGLPPTVDGIRNLTQQQAVEIYKNKYWERGQLDSFPRDVQFDFFTSFINGEGRAVKALQKMVGLTGGDIDGVMGPQTAGKVQEYLDQAGNRESFGKLYKMEYLLGLADNAGDWGSFGNGWANRYLETDEFGRGKINLNAMSRREARDMILERKDQFLSSLVGPPVEGAEGGETTQEAAQETKPEPTPVTDGIYEDPDTGKPFRMQGGRMYDLRTGERLDVDPVQDTGPDVGTIREGTGGYIKKELEGSVQDNLAGSGNASLEEMKTGVKELTGANLMKNVTEALDRGDTTGAALEVAFEGIPILGDMGRAMFIGFKRAVKSGANTQAGAELLQRAIDMEDAGKSAKVIKEELNMHRAPDGAWRKEISDAPSEVKADIQFAPEGKAQIDRMSGAVRFANREAMPTLDQVFKHDELFGEYPDLKDVRVALLKSTDSADGTMYRADGVLAIHPRLLKDEAKLRQVILHEIQHSIQNYEGFIGGGQVAKAAKRNMANARIGLEFLKQENPELAGMSNLALETMMRYQDENYAFTKQSPKAQEAIRELAAEYNKAKDALDKAYDDYLRIHGEAEARATEYSADMGLDERAVRDPYTERNDPNAITDGRFLDERKKRL